mmetsp:Transcript_22801/g.49301  ORF Transcript_22801/g.49301 Transcript_22801/m.49301 type:complete len:161 (-) Transcript_22801:1616-2098(-)
MVITRKKYLKRNLKPLLKVGAEVYAAWWEDNDRTTAATWHPGVISSRRESKFGGPYGPIRFYDITFDDGDKLDSVEDYFVMNKVDYLLSIRKAIDRDGDSDTEGLNGGNYKRWIGVKNKLDKHSVDAYFKEVGWYSATIDGQEKAFSYLSGEKHLFILAV